MKNNERHLMSISEVPCMREVSASVDSNSSALSRMKFCCICEILAMIFSFLLAASLAFLFFAASFSSLLKVVGCSVGPRASAKLVICLTSINICWKNSSYTPLINVCKSGSFLTFPPLQNVLLFLNYTFCLYTCKLK